MVRLFLICLLISCSSTPAWAESACVILLHGLARTSGSMGKIANSLEESGYTVANIGYPSRKKPIAELAETAVPAGMAQCATANAGTVHFVTHSLGGILVRYYLSRHSISNLGRVVMLAPPNQGSEVVDQLRSVPGFKLMNGPAGVQLGTDAVSIPLQLGPVDYPVGVIAGTRTINPILSTYLPDQDDGKVSVRRSQVQGMADFIALPVSHTFIMRDDEAIAQIKAFLQSGSFEQHSR